MHALQLQAARPPLAVGRAARRAAKRGLRRPRAADDTEGMSWLTQRAGEMEAAAEAEAAAAAAEADADRKARSVGLHIRGRSAMRQGLVDEEDPLRWDYHRTLKDAALDGRTADAEETLSSMQHAGFRPGPRAYHALVVAYAQDGDAQGALGAIRRCWEAGVTPLPTTYAAVVEAAVTAGDMDTAEAVVVSNQRAGVDWTASWEHLITALFRGGEGDRAWEVLTQGETAGLEPGPEVLAALITHLCSQGQLDEASGFLSYLKDEDRLGHEELRYSKIGKPGIELYQPLLLALIDAGRVEDARNVLDDMTSFGLLYEQGGKALCYKVLEAQLALATSRAEVNRALNSMQFLMVTNGLPTGPRFYGLQLKAALRLKEEKAAISAFHVLRSPSWWNERGLGLIEDEDLINMLLVLRDSDLAAELYDLMYLVVRADRALPQEAMQPGDNGCTFLGSWVRRRLDSGPGEDALQLAAAPRSQASLFDGVFVDSKQLAVTDAASQPVPVTRMTVRQLRAELAANRLPVAGNKKEMVKRVQKLRMVNLSRQTGIAQKAPPKSDSKRKMVRVVTVKEWSEWEALPTQVFREVDAPLEQEEEEEEEPEVDDVWDEEEGASARRGTNPLDDGGEDDDDEEGGLDSLNPIRNLYLEPKAPFLSPQAAPVDAAAMLLTAVADMGATPTRADWEAVAEFAQQGQDVAAAVQLVAALDSLAARQAEQAAAGEAPASSDFDSATAGDLRWALATLCTEVGGPEFDLEAEVAAMLQAGQALVDEDQLADDVEMELDGVAGERLREALEAWDLLQAAEEQEVEAAEEAAPGPVLEALGEGAIAGGGGGGQ